ncbi:hypothetical protein [Niveibacterium terrae]|uniref:hypothetical protein n=1 Tax=Niveibacterium terrae TaxID=3373598 RepID=UPI003A92EABF
MKHPSRPLSPFLGRILLVLSGLIVSAACVHAETLNLVYPRPVSAFDHRSEYPLKLLELALAKSGTAFTLRASTAVMNKARVADELALGREINVAWMVTSREREARLLPVRICVFKGLGGWRIALVRQKDLPLFAKVRTLKDLQKLAAGQQLDWPDTAILRASAIPVETSSSYDSLFAMLTNGRFSWFPRSIPEIWAEAQSHKGQGLVVEPHLLVRYPSAYYFFVNRRDERIAWLIESGLERSIKDGSFDKLFLEYHGDVLARAKIRDRVIIDLPNPFLPPQTPLARKELWFHSEHARTR